MSEKNMKRSTSHARRRSGSDAEYKFDYSKSRPNRFASRFPKDAVVVVLDSDVAKVFRDPKGVNSLPRPTSGAVKKRGSKKAG